MNAPTPDDTVRIQDSEPEDPRDPDGKLLRLQKRFLRAFAWLRRSSGKTQRDVASETGWKQPYVARLEDERSPLIMSLARMERYAQACGATGVLMFVDQRTGQVRRTLALGDDGEELLRQSIRHRIAQLEDSFGFIEMEEGKIAGEPLADVLRSYEADASDGAMAADIAPQRQT